MAEIMPAGIFKTRILVQKSKETISISLQDVAFFYSENKVVFVIDVNENKYIYDNNLSDFQSKLNPRVFFRVNRQYIVNINVIKSFKRFERVKLELKLNLPHFKPHIIISQQRAPLFKKWMEEM